MKRMFFSCLAIATAGFLAVSTAAQAGAIVNVSGNGNVVEDFSDMNELDFAVTAFNDSPVMFDVTTASGETSPLALSALVDNFLGINLASIQIGLGNGATFSELGQVGVINTFGGVDPIDADVSGIGTSTLVVDFASSLLQGRTLVLGNPSGDSTFNPPAVDDMDFGISFTGTDGFSVTTSVTAVPEPAGLSVFSAAAVLGLVGGRRRRAAKKVQVAA